jgi:hypothetical protein
MLFSTLSFLTAPVFAADNTDSEIQNSLAPGSWSLQFRITDNFQLSSFQGATISAKRHFSEGRALRFGISLSGSVTDKEYRTTDQSSDSTTSEVVIGADENQQYLRFDAQYLIYPSPMKKLNLFFGAGPLFELSRSEVSIFDQERVNKIWSIGLTTLLGVEWFATKRISILSEYASTLSYDFQSSESTHSDGKSKNVDEVQTLSFSYTSVKFGLSVYW